MTSADVVGVVLPSGVVEVPTAWTHVGDPRAVVLLTPGAGAGHDHPFLVGFAAALADAGCSSVRFDFPYRAQGRRMPGPASHAIAAWGAVASAVRERTGDLPLVAAGKSYGGRMASMAAAEGVIDPTALVYLGYPLHPPGRPEALRVAHLPQIAAPQLFVSGRNDPFVDPAGQLEEAVASCPRATLHWTDGTHSFEVKGNRRPADVIGAELAPAVAAWILAQLAS